MDGMKPKINSKKDGINLMPTLTIIENADGRNGQKLFTPLSAKSVWALEAFCHAFGVPLDRDPADGSGSLPGDFDGNLAQPETLKNYAGPLLNQLADVVVTPSTYKGKPSNDLKFICRVPGCDVKHPDK
jgi:hypothetical protein